MSQCLNPDCLQTNSDNAQFCQKCGDKLRLRERYWAKYILGEGGFGRTFLAVDEDKPSKPPCVIKQFLPQAQGTESIQKASELFAQEAQRLEELGKHSQIPELFAYFTSDNRQYLVQEFIDGQNLQTELEQNGVFKESQIRELLQDLLTVLQFVHNNQVIHRDIKPENIIRRNADKKLVLVDFGAAKYIKPVQRSVTGTVIGSAEYCAPEQSMGKPKFISDLYSLGVTCLHLLTQVSPFELYDVMEAEWAWRDFLNGNSVSDELGSILDRLIEPKPKSRYQSVAEVLNCFQPSSPQISVPSSPTPNFTPISPPVVPFSKQVTPSRYQRLEALLKGGKWREADEETGKVMCQVAGREEERCLNTESIDNFPCEDLRAIDQLWIKYSKGRFGFSVQKRIYQSLGGTREYDEEIWQKFGDRVGWRRKWRLYYKDWDFTSKAPQGHLPSLWVLGWWGDWVWWVEKDLVRLFSRVETCRM
ncbi:serine/threonine-protein kinase [Spirulina sp. 06S082]|uniref:serine/threonine-protein kinase n=1 Tax=Spirulina sp. 06S082 TaxID=3110248 RepID=UPI002B213B4D|nr:serine/threonine-protein kinase [Spirulina sp. 06S082]MEA5471310.1 serine/threonine-protein kinase [Spirulina sp. 06S082]